MIDENYVLQWMEDNVGGPEPFDIEIIERWIEQESGFDQFAIGYGFASCAGIVQMNEPTAREMGLYVDRYWETVLNDQIRNFESMKNEGLVDGVNPHERSRLIVESAACDYIVDTNHNVYRTQHWYQFVAKLDERLDWKRCLTGGHEYLAKQYRHMPEIPDVDERRKFALACYNCGRGHVNKALEFARAACGIDIDLPWREQIKTAGQWQEWIFAKEFLKKLKIDWPQVFDYVEKIC